MSLIAPPRYRLPDVTLTPYGDQMRGLAAGAPIAPTSTAVASTPVFFPIYLVEPFTVAKAFWANAATVGTNNIDLGVYRMTNQATGRCDLIRSTGAVLSAGASAVQEVSAWKVARTNLTADASSTDATTYTTASVTLKAGRLYLLAVTNSKADTPDAVTSVSGATWTSEATVLFDTAATPTKRLTVMRCVPTVDTVGTLVINFTGTQLSCCWSLTEMSGVDTATTQGCVQNKTATTDGATTVVADFDAAFGSANNATYVAVAHVTNEVHAPGANFTELADVGAATPALALEVGWYVGEEQTADATWATSCDGAAIAVEVKADASPFIIPPSLPGNPDIYMAFAMDGTTARILFASTGASGHRSSGYLTLASTFPLPSTCIPGAATTTRIPLAGFSLRSLIG